MDIKNQAKEFAIKAHEGQIRKADPSKPYIVHPMNVAEILKNYGYDDHIIAAGYLHDVVEDTNYTLQDIEDAFDKDISSLVAAVSETDKTLSWEERKQRMINNLKETDLRNKVIACADKIDNIESLTELLTRKGISAFDSFKRGYDKQLWYYKNVYKSIIHNENKELPIFKRLKNVIILLEEEINKNI